MRLLTCIGLLAFGWLLSGIGVSSQEFPEQRQEEGEISTKTILDNLSASDETVLFAHHLQLPLYSPLKQLLDDKSKTSTVFVPDNKALIEFLQRSDQIWCENGEFLRTDGRFKRLAKKQIVEVFGNKEYEKLTVTNEDCENYIKLLQLDQKVLRDVSRLRTTDRYRDPSQRRQQFKLLLSQNADEYNRIRFSPSIEKFALAKTAYASVPGRVDVKEMEPRGKKILQTYLSQPDVLPISGWESNTKLVLKKTSEGGLNIVFSSPNSPVWRAEVDDRPIESANGLIYMIRRTVPYPHKLSSMLLCNKLFFTHALLNYTGLLDQLDSRQDITVFTPTDRAWMTVLPQMVDKPTIRRMTADVKKRFNLMMKLPLIRRQMEEQQEREEKKRISAEEQPTYIRLKEVETEDFEEKPFDSSQITTLRRLQLGKNEMRELLLSHVSQGIHFSDQLQRYNTITAMSGMQLPVNYNPDRQQFNIGKSRLIFSNIPINNGVMHIVDDVTTEPNKVATRIRMGVEGQF